MTIFPPKIQQHIEPANQSKTIRAAIYARTSSFNQKFNYSINEQIAVCQKYIEQRNWVTKYIFYDECETARNLDRPRFRLMIKKAKMGLFDVVVFWKIDRFCRSLLDLITLEKSLRECNVSLCSSTQFIDTTNSIGRFNFRSIGSVAELESELISERSRLGLAGLAKTHRWPNNSPPLGYKRVEDGRLKIYGKEARLVRKIFRMYLNEKSMSQVAFKLNKANVLTKKGLKWTAVAVRNILADSIYVGLYKVAGISDYVPEYRIIEDSLFDTTTKFRLRYRQKNAQRPQMPKDRKEAQVDKMFTAYFTLLKEETNQ